MGRQPLSKIDQGAILLDVPKEPVTAWAAAGFGPDLLPIIPPGATLSPKATVQPSDAGKVPGVFIAGAWAGFPRWTEVQADEHQRAFWASLVRDHGAGLGLQARRWPAVDIDVTDAAMAGQLGMLAAMYLGPAPERVGRAPKSLRAYRLADGAPSIGKRRITFSLPTDPETTHAIEILGSGQQYVVEGTHPRTLAPYTWTGGKSPADLGAAGLTPVTAARVDAYLDAVETMLRGAGAAIHGRTAVDPAAPPVPEGAVYAIPEALLGDPDIIREALIAAGNRWNYDDWIALSAAIKAALGADETHYPIYEEWCLAYPGGTAEEARRKWDSLHPPYRLGADFVLRKCAESGWGGWTDRAFGALLDDGTDYTDPALPAYIRDYVYATEQERFVNLHTMQVHKESVFARIMSSPGIGPDSSKNPAKLFFQSPARRLVETLTYLPGGPKLCAVNGKSAVNLWVEDPFVERARCQGALITDADVQPWLDHWARLVPDARIRAHFYDWMAYVLQRPANKPNWALFLGGVQGIGKDLAFAPFVRAVGPANTRTVQPGELASEYTDWMANRRLVLVEEMRNFETRTVMNKLKMYVTRPPEVVPVHLKYMPVYEVPNVACFVFMSNFKDALSLEKGDRRYLVHWSEAIPAPQAYFDALAAYLEGAGNLLVAAWLMARDVTAFAPFAAGRAPDTDSKTEMQEAGRNEFEQAVVEGIEAGAPPFAGDIVTIDALWSALPGDLKRLPGASLRRLGAAIQDAGGGGLRGPDGKPRRVYLDTSGQSRFGRPRVWALRDLGGWSAASEEQVRRAFRQRWAADDVVAATEGAAT